MKAQTLRWTLQKWKGYKRTLPQTGYLGKKDILRNTQANETDTEEIENQNRPQQRDGLSH